MSIIGCIKSVINYAFGVTLCPHLPLFDGFKSFNFLFHGFLFKKCLSIKYFRYSSVPGYANKRRA